MDEGTVREVEEGYELRYERELSQPVEEVWEAITEPGHLADWLGAAEVDLRPGGRIRIIEEGGTQIDGEVLMVEVPRVLSYKWDSAAWGDGGPVRFELAETESGGTLLVFTHLQPRAAFGHYHLSKATRWQAHLNGLQAGLLASMAYV